MSTSGSTRSHQPPRPHKVSVASMVVRVLALLAVLMGILLLSAGRLDWLQGWAFGLSFCAYSLFYSIWTLQHDPAQFAERGKMEKNVKGWDKIIMSFYTMLLFALLIVAGLDGGRFHWAPVPPGWQVLGWIVMVLAGCLIFWTASVNTFLSRWVRIQDDRQQQTVMHGPYHWIRHPMYLGAIMFILAIPLVLDSLSALIPAVLICILFILRTALEDVTLQTELPGYQEYARMVRYRLFPGVW